MKKHFFDIDRQIWFDKLYRTCCWFQNCLIECCFTVILCFHWCLPIVPAYKCFDLCQVYFRMNSHSLVYGLCDSRSMNLNKAIQSWAINPLCPPKHIDIRKCWVAELIPPVSVFIFPKNLGTRDLFEQSCFHLLWDINNWDQMWKPFDLDAPHK